VSELFKGMHALAISTTLLSNLDLRSVISKWAGQLHHLNIHFANGSKYWYSGGGHGINSTVLADLSAHCPSLRSLRLAGRSYIFPLVDDANLLMLLNSATKVNCVVAKSSCLAVFSDVRVTF
jgi:hypothetical protein